MFFRNKEDISLYMIWCPLIKNIFEKKSLWWRRTKQIGKAVTQSVEVIRGCIQLICHSCMCVHEYISWQGEGWLVRATGVIVFWSSWTASMPEARGGPAVWRLYLPSTLGCGACTVRHHIGPCACVWGLWVRTGEPASKAALLPCYVRSFTLSISIFEFDLI